MVCTIIATHIRAVNQREEENKLFALDWLQSSALKRTDVDELRSGEAGPMLAALFIALLKRENFAALWTA